MQDIDGILRTNDYLRETRCGVMWQFNDKERRLISVI